MANQIDTRALAVDIAKILDTKKARDIKILRVNEKTVLADYFVIATGTSTTHVKSLADEVEYEVSTKLKIEPASVEGRGLGNWTLIDYENVIVHVFNPQAKDFYNLDKLWADCEEIEFEKIED